MNSNADKIRQRIIFALTITQKQLYTNSIMTEEEKKVFEEFLQWKAEKKKREEEAERQAKLAAQKSIAAEQARVETDIINTPEANEWENEKSKSDKLIQKGIFGVCIIILIALIAILANIDHTPKKEQEPATRENIQKDDESIRIDSIKKANRIDKVKHSIKIIKAYLSAPNSAGGVDAHFIWKNVSDKTIKYLTWSGYPINAVGDAVACEIRGRSESGGKVTGPIKPGTTYGYGYYWECLWYNYSAKKLVLTGIDIEYMDGSTMRINQNELKYIR